MRKIRQTFIISLVSVLVMVFLAGCGTASRQQLLATEKSQVALRSIQTRAFDMTDKKKMLRAIIATLQDLDFVIDMADLTIGSVTGSKFASKAVIKLSVIVRPRGGKQLLVRASAQYGIQSVEDPEPYQDFFTALEKALFLAAHQVD